MERVLPERDISLFGLSFSLNPGPWSIKEHLLGVDLDLLRDYLSLIYVQT